MGLFSRKKKEEPAPIIVQPKGPKTQTKVVNFAIVGQDYNNIDGKNCLKVLKEVANEEFYGHEPFQGYTVKDCKDLDLKVEYFEDQDFLVDFEHYEFEGEPAIRVYIVDGYEEKHHIGWIAASRVKRFNNLMKKIADNDRKYICIVIHGVKVRSASGTETEDWRPMVEVSYAEIVEE